MTMNLSTKMVISTLAIGGLFIGGLYLAQSFSEHYVLAQAEKQEKVPPLEETHNEFDRIENLSLKEYYIDELQFDPRLMEALIEKYGHEINNLKMKDMLDGSQKEKVMYVDALHSIFELGEQPILTKNELKEKNENGDLEIVLNEDGEYSYSLETRLRDTNALSKKIDSTKPIKTICEKYGIDYNGKTGDLTPEIIIEIDKALFAISNHAKN